MFKDGFTVFCFCFLSLFGLFAAFRLFTAFRFYDINTVGAMVPYLFLLLVYGTSDETCFFLPQFDADFSRDFSVVPCPPSSPIRGGVWVVYFGQKPGKGKGLNMGVWGTSPQCSSLPFCPLSPYYDAAVNTCI